MNNKNIEQKTKYKKGLGMAVAVGLTGGLYACAYDPPMEAAVGPKADQQCTPEEKPAVQNAEVVPVRAAVEELAAPNSYQVRLAWKADNASSSVVISRENLASGETLQIITLEPTVTEYVDRSVQPKTPYRYHLGRTTASGFKSETAEAKIPIDFIVDGAKVVNAVGPEFNRLWILANSTLLTQGNDLRIEVNRIFAADNAAIDTTPPGSWAAPRTPGKSGGNVTIKSKTASGRLKIFATGQGGGQGAQGASGGPGGKGPKGSPAETRRESSTECDRHCPSHTVCSRNPGNGGQGNQGGQGLPGLGGYPGGDSAKVLIAIESPIDFEVTPFVSPGAGGASGVGGVGGPGGPGGDPGDNKSPCTAAQPGPLGGPGPQGGSGPQGPSGAAQPICLKLGASLVGDCSGFSNMTQ